MSDRGRKSRRTQQTDTLPVHSVHVEEENNENAVDPRPDFKGVLVHGWG